MGYCVLSSINIFVRSSTECLTKILAQSTHHLIAHSHSAEIIYEFNCCRRSLPWLHARQNCDPQRRGTFLVNVNTSSKQVSCLFFLLINTCSSDVASSIRSNVRRIGVTQKKTFSTILFRWFCGFNCFRKLSPIAWVHLHSRYGSVSTIESQDQE